MTKMSLEEKFDSTKKFLLDRFEKEVYQAQKELGAFCLIDDHPGYLLESADRMFENAAKVEVLRVLLKRVRALPGANEFHILVKEYEEAVVFSAMRGSRSTSDCRNLMEEMRLAVKAQATKDMRELADSLR